jgi:hypothetical protein
LEPFKNRTETKSSRESKSRHAREKERGKAAEEDERSERTKRKLAMPKFLYLVTISILENVLDGVTARKETNPRTPPFFFLWLYIYIAKILYFKLKVLNSCAF